MIRLASLLTVLTLTACGGKAAAPAASCQGDPDCADSDEVDLIVTITAAP